MNIVQGAGVEAVLPKVPASSVHPVDVLCIPEIRATDGLRQRLLPCGHADKMNYPLDSLILARKLALSRACCF
jgi:hypothetical protein